jgi:hypothetical protein
MLYSSTTMICIAVSSKTSVHLWKLTQRQISEGSHSEVSDRAECKQEIFCIEISLRWNTALTSSVFMREGHYEQTFSEAVNVKREDGKKTRICWHLMC